MSKYAGAHLNEGDVMSQEGLRSNTGKTCLEDRTNVVEIKDKDSAEYFQHISESREIPMYNTKQSSMLVAHFSLFTPTIHLHFHPLASDNGNGQRNIFPEAHSFIAPLLPTYWSSHCHSAYRSRTRLHYMADIKPFTQLFQGVKVLLIKPLPQPPSPLGLSTQAHCFTYWLVNPVPMMLLPFCSTSAHRSLGNRRLAIGQRVKGFLFGPPHSRAERAMQRPCWPAPPPPAIGPPREAARARHAQGARHAVACARAGAEDAHTTIWYTRIVIFLTFELRPRDPPESFV
ncbi:hypothetical protein FB451DRAFT_1190547 [Mycena latifolia]|nr:hypothetical protein FB451DRAFT_1190547 [Mycena latifolia]